MAASSCHSRIICIIATLVVLATSSSVSATEYNVGDASGWTLDFDYQTWAKDKVFMVGDKLVFNYAAGAHNVMKVNGTAFQQCAVTSSNGTLTSGRDIIPLLTPGRKWYICGVAKHCELKNMKLAITVVTMAPAPSPSSAFILALPTIYGSGATLIIFSILLLLV